MGSFYDYFRAPDADAVKSLMESLDGAPLLREGYDPPVEVVDVKIADPDVILGQLVGFVLNTPWEVDLMDTQLVWPSEAEAAYSEQLTVSIGDRARDALASIEDAQLPELAARWAGVEELSYYTDMGPQATMPYLTDLVGLTRRAKTNGEHLYCCMSL